MVKVSQVVVAPFISEDIVEGKVSFNDGLTFNFTRAFDSIVLERSRKYNRQGRMFRPQNHERALQKIFA